MSSTLQSKLRDSVITQSKIVKLWLGHDILKKKTSSGFPALQNKIAFYCLHASNLAPHLAFQIDLVDVKQIWEFKNFVIARQF